MVVDVYQLFIIRFLYRGMRRPMRNGACLLRSLGAGGMGRRVHLSWDFGCGGKWSCFCDTTLFALDRFSVGSVLSSSFSSLLLFLRSLLVPDILCSLFKLVSSS